MGKFDIRLYVCVSSWNPPTVWLFDKGIVRFSSVLYTDDISDVSSHLTNASIHEKLKSGKADKPVIGKGVKWSLDRLFEHITELGADRDLIWAQIEEMVALTCCATMESMKDEPQCFEIFG